MNVRPATPTDVPAVLPMVASICEMHKQLDAAKYGFLPNPQAKYENWLKTPSTSDRSVFLVATDDS
jgi:hypothetical protein